jgi:hypothetical protein
LRTGITGLFLYQTVWPVPSSLPLVACHLGQKSQTVISIPSPNTCRSKNGWSCGFVQTVIDRMIGTTVNLLDTYLPALLSVIFANELPKEAIARVEAGFCAHDRSDE